MLTRWRALNLLAGLLLAVGAAVAKVAAAADGELIYVGTHGTQIYAARFDASTGDLSSIGAVADNPRPTWAVGHPSLPIAYFVNEGGNDGKAEGTVQAFRVDRKTGALTLFSEMHAGASGTTHLWLDASSQTLLVANYSGAVASLPLARDGSLGEPISVINVTGSGPHRRQASAHAHGVVVDPSGRYALVCDLGADRIWTLPFDRQSHKLGPYDPTGPLHFTAPAGSGPRHLNFHPDGTTVYSVNELNATIDTFRWTAKLGRLEKLQNVSTDDPAYTGDKSAAELAVSSDGRFLYVSNRGDHAIVVLAVDPRTKTLSVVQRIPSGGARPWHFAIHRSGGWLLVANRDADALTLFAIDRKTGQLTNTGKTLSIPEPVHVHFSGL